MPTIGERATVPFSFGAAAGAASALGAAAAEMCIRDRVSAKDAMIKSGVPVVPGSDGPLPEDEEEALRIAREVGYPVIIKAAGGGGGRGMRVVRNEAEPVSYTHLPASTHPRPPACRR